MTNYESNPRFVPCDVCGALAALDGLFCAACGSDQTIPDLSLDMPKKGRYTEDMTNTENDLHEDGVTPAQNTYVVTLTMTLDSASEDGAAETFYELLETMGAGDLQVTRVPASAQHA